MTRRAILLIILTALAAGCASSASSGVAKLPTVQWKTTDDALRILRERAGAIRTATATGTITFTRPNGESVRLDLAMVSAPPDRLRLRAWKLGRAVFDLTLTPDGLWLFTPEDPSMRNKVRGAGLDAGRIARQWSMLSGALFERDDLVVSGHARELEVAAPRAQPPLVCYVDRRTLVPTRYQLRDPDRTVRFFLDLSDYREIVGISYPHRLDAKSDSGQIAIHFEDVELNQDLAPAAFVPPKRAEKLP